MLSIHIHIQLAIVVLSIKHNLYMIMDARAKGRLGVLNLMGWNIGGNFVLHLCAAATY